MFIIRLSLPSYLQYFNISNSPSKKRSRKREWNERVDLSLWPFSRTLAQPPGNVSGNSDGACAKFTSLGDTKIGLPSYYCRIIVHSLCPLQCGIHSQCSTNNSVPSSKWSEINHHKEVSRYSCVWTPVPTTNTYLLAMRQEQVFGYSKKYLLSILLFN